MSHDQQREFFGGADGDVWTYNAALNKWGPAAPPGGGGGAGDIDSVTVASPLTGGGTSGAVSIGLGTVPIAKGGTGATTAGAALTALGAAAAAHVHAAADVTSGTLATARLGSGTADGTTFLRGDQTWATPSGGGSVGSASLSRSTDQTISNAAVTYVTFDTEDWDSSTLADVGTANNRITFPVVGYAQITANARFANNGTGVRFVAVEVYTSANVLKYRAESMILPSGAVQTDGNATGAFKIAAGDYAKMWVYQTSGGNLALQGRVGGIAVTHLTCLFFPS